MSVIPVQQIVQIDPEVVSGGGQELQLIGLGATTNPRVPIAPLGNALSFGSAPAVSAYFGPGAKETSFATTYFEGPTNALQIPSSLLFAQYPQTAVGAYLRGGSIASLTIPQLQAISGEITILIDGYSYSAASVNLSGDTSFSAAAGTLQTALNTSLPVGASFTATIGASFTATGTGTSLAVTAVTGIISPGDVIAGTGIPGGTTIVSGPPAGGAGTYVTSAVTTAATASVTATSTVLNVTALASGNILPNQTLTGTGVGSGNIILSQIAGATGGIGTYRITTGKQVVSEAMTGVAPALTCSFDSVSGGLVINSGSTGNASTITYPIGTDATGSACTTTGMVLTVGGTVTGTFQVGDTVTGTDSTNTLPVNTIITSQLTGTTGGAGTYELSAAAAPGNLTSCAVTSMGPTGALISGLMLTQQTGAVLSAGAAATTPAAFMNAVIGQTTNWAGFTTLFNPDALGNTGNAVKLAFAAWNGAQNDSYAYIAWDTDITPTLSANASSSLGQIINTDAISGTFPIYEPTDLHHAAFVLGCGAAIDYSEPNGNTTFAFRSQSGLVPGVTNLTAANNLLDNFYNYYGIYKDRAGNTYNILYKGNVSGPFQTLQNYYNQIWFNSALQSAVIQGFVAARTVPYDAVGNATIESWLLGPVQNALDFGMIQIGVTLSPTQINAAKTAAGLDISSQLQTQGYYIQVLTASAAVRNAQGSPPANVFYVVGGNVITLNVPSIAFL